MSASGLCAAVLALLVPISASASSQERDAGVSLKPCAVVTGAPFNYPAPGSGATLSGDHYYVNAGGVSCSVAQASATVLSTSDPKVYEASYDLNLLYNPAGTKKAAWPAGYTCAGNSYMLKRHKPPTISGYCWKGSSNPYGSSVTGIIFFRAKPNREGT